MSEIYCREDDMLTAEVGKLLEALVAELQLPDLPSVQVKLILPHQVDKLRL